MHKDWSQHKGVTIGKLCRHGHDHGGGSYRYPNKKQLGPCVQCAAEYRARPRVRKSIAITRAKWNAVNPGKAKGFNRKYRRNNSERVLLLARNWRRANKALVTAYAAKRRAAELRATPKWADHAAMKTVYNEAASLSRSTGIEYHVDHVVPLKHPKVCGLHVEFNLQVLTKKDNLSKCNRFEVGI